MFVQVTAKNVGGVFLRHSVLEMIMHAVDPGGWRCFPLASVSSQLTDFFAY